MQTIEQYLVKDAENQTAYLRVPRDAAWWYWYGSEIETQAYYLKLLARTDPQGRDSRRAGEVPAQQPQARHVLEQHP